MAARRIDTIAERREKKRERSIRRMIRTVKRKYWQEAWEYRHDPRLIDWEKLVPESEIRAKIEDEMAKGTKHIRIPAIVKKRLDTE